MKHIAHIRTDFGTKFGIPRQSGIVNKLVGKIVMEPEYRVREAFRGLEEFSHLWLIWHFSEIKKEEWSPTVRPPKLGGNKRVGVFATRSPFRPNSMGLSSVKLKKIDYEAVDGPVLWVEGADLMDHTPIFDIKPYLPFTDCHPEAKGGFTDEVLRTEEKLKIMNPEAIDGRLPKDKAEALVEVLKNDPRPQYHEDKDRIYGIDFCGKDIRFRVEGDQLTIIV
ncbi:MAG: tRNA (N6-threonylcarbamoyladenosine(37)-N6)-methyltransferase TrmO [Bacteroidales bacterium]|nr:tRNA (N6-threonylcarbamoyladenosine(37)-N6)-methyltransferase TrmO [Bacteroidales bacterium]